MSLLLKLRHSLSALAACLLLGASIAIAATPSPAYATTCYRNCNNCMHDDCTYENQSYCCTWCEGGSPSCDCSFFCS
jgi:hypothetical protein